MFRARFEANSVMGFAIEFGNRYNRNDRVYYLDKNGLLKYETLWFDGKRSTLTQNDYTRLRSPYRNERCGKCGRIHRNYFFHPEALSRKYVGYQHFDDLPSVWVNVWKITRSEQSAWRKAWTSAPPYPAPDALIDGLCRSCDARERSATQAIARLKVVERQIHYLAREAAHIRDKLAKPMPQTASKFQQAQATRFFQMQSTANAIKRTTEQTNETTKTTVS